MMPRLRKFVLTGTALLVGGLFAAVPACSDSSGPGGGLRQARAVVYGTVTDDGDPVADVQVVLLPHNAPCTSELLGGAAPPDTTGGDGRYRIVLNREIIGSSVTVCPELTFTPPTGSPLLTRTIQADDALVELRDLNAGIGIDSVDVSVDLAP